MTPKSPKDSPAAAIAAVDDAAAAAGAAQAGADAGSTPLATLQALRQALAAEAWERALALLSPRAQQGMVGAAIAAAAWHPALQQPARHGLAALLAQHGLIGDASARRPQAAARSPAELACILADLAAWARQGPASLQQVLPNAASFAPDDCRILREDDQHAEFIVAQDGHQRSIRLRRCEERWIILASGE